jgi:hypothetical protein
MAATFNISVREFRERDAPPRVVRDIIEARKRVCLKRFLRKHGTPFGDGLDSSLLRTLVNLTRSAEGRHEART